MIVSEKKRLSSYIWTENATNYEMRSDFFNNGFYCFWLFSMANVAIPAEESISRFDSVSQSHGGNFPVSTSSLIAAMFQP